MSIMFAPLNIIGGWGVGKILYNSLAKQMAKDLPEIANLIKNGRLDTIARDRAVDKWLAMKVKNGIKSGLLDELDEVTLKSENSKKVLESLTREIELSNPNFFKKPKNVDFFLKAAPTTIKKEIGDPSDLGTKSKDLLLRLIDNSSDSWDSKGQESLLTIFDNAVTELRYAAKNDPATYAKFSTNQAAQDQIFVNALRRSGAKEKDLQAMVQCALPIK